MRAVGLPAPLIAEENRELVERINRQGPGIVFIGLGCPLQERFAHAHRHSIHAVPVCVGVAFDFIAGTELRVPRRTSGSRCSGLRLKRGSYSRGTLSLTTVLITGSCGLIGSEAVRFYDRRCARVIGLDNNARAAFFGPDGDTSWRRAELQATCRRYHHVDADVRDRSRMATLVHEARPDLIVHCAAQPSHDLAAQIPLVDFEINATGSLNLLEATRQHAPDAVFVFMSTNKVYGDAPNRIELRELPTRWDFADPTYADGIDETMAIDQSLHSLFGASKAAADLLVQEYGRYFGMKTVCFRAGCLTGAGHSGAELHGFLAYLFKAAALRRSYTVFGYQGKQVRDQIHSRDVIQAVDAFFRQPRCGAVYNLGGGKANSISILESIDRIEQLLGRKVNWSLSDEPRNGDHVCYYTDLTRFRSDYPDWELSVDLDQIFDEMASSQKKSGSDFFSEPGTGSVRQENAAC